VTIWQVTTHCKPATAQGAQYFDESMVCAHCSMESSPVLMKLRTMYRYTKTYWPSTISTTAPGLRGWSGCRGDICKIIDYSFRFAMGKPFAPSFLESIGAAATTTTPTCIYYLLQPQRSQLRRNRFNRTLEHANNYRQRYEDRHRNATTHAIRAATARS
jgi:hypothetical protein